MCQKIEDAQNVSNYVIRKSNALKQNGNNISSRAGWFIQEFILQWVSSGRISYQFNEGYILTNKSDKII